MELFAFWIIMAAIAGMIASSKGSSFFGFFIYGLAIWPIAIVHALLMRDEVAAPAPVVAHPIKVAERPSREIVGVVQGVAYWSEGGGRFGATIGGEVMIFPSIELLTAAVTGQSKAAAVDPMISRPLPDDMEISEPVYHSSGRVSLVANGVTRYFGSIAEATAWINSVRR